MILKSHQKVELIRRALVIAKMKADILKYEQVNNASQDNISILSRLQQALQVAVYNYLFLSRHYGVSETVLIYVYNDIFKDYIEHCKSCDDITNQLSMDDYFWIFMRQLLDGYSEDVSIASENDEHDDDSDLSSYCSYR